VDPPTVPAIERIARDPIQGRQATPGAEQKYVLFGPSGNVEAIAERLGDRHAVSGLHVLEDPAADQPAGYPAHVHDQVTVQRGNAGEGVVARGPGIHEQAYELTGAILERGRRPDVHGADLVVQTVDRSNGCLDTFDHIVGQRDLEILRRETLAGEKELARHHRRRQPLLRRFGDDTPDSAHEA
jgi:hypothetical protein